MSPPTAGLLWLLISGITIKITAYLLSRELEVDLSRSDVDDRIGGVEERSSQYDRCIIFFLTYVQNHEVGRGKLIVYSYHDIFLYSLQKSVIGPPTAVACM